MRTIACLVLVCLLGACLRVPESEPSATLPATRWDHRPEATQWTQATLDALKAHGAGLTSVVPRDITEWCPGYATATVDDRSAFWVGLFSALAEYESTWNPAAVGGGGLWYGLVQIDPRTARSYGCEATSGGALKSGVANLSCAVRIAARQVPKNGTVSRGMRDWGPFHASDKRAAMASYTRAQPYCQPAPEKPKMAALFAPRTGD